MSTLHLHCLALSHWKRATAERAAERLEERGSLGPAEAGDVLWGIGNRVGLRKGSPYTSVGEGREKGPPWASPEATPISGRAPKGGS